MRQACAPELPPSKVSEKNIAIPHDYPRFIYGLKQADDNTLVKIKHAKSDAKREKKSSSAYVIWKDFFADENLRSLIEVALKNNQELNRGWHRISLMVMYDYGYNSL